MDKSGSDAGIASNHAPQVEKMDAIEKMLMDSQFTADEVHEFFINRLQAGRTGENQPPVLWYQLGDFKPENDRETSMIKFLGDARSEIAGLSDDESFVDLNLSSKDLEQFKLRYGGDYRQNVERLAELTRRFKSSLPALDENGDGVLTKHELRAGAEDNSLDERTRKFSAFLHSDYENLAHTHFATKYTSGYQAVGLSKFQFMEECYDFSKTRGAANSLFPGYTNNINRLRLQTAAWLESAVKKGIFD